jgi:hypothetical protein
MKTYVHLWKYLTHFFIEWEMLKTNFCRENQNTHFMLNKCLPRKSYRLLDNVEKYCTAGPTTDDSTAHALCMLDN